MAISGDLTQRARVVQFAEARAFLDRLPKPVIVVPGNHDIPLDDVASRFLRPLSGYRRYITDEPMLKMLGDVKGLRVLDAGCGTGRYSFELAKRGYATPFWED